MICKIAYGAFPENYTDMDISKNNALRELLGMNDELDGEFKQQELHTMEVKNKTLSSVGGSVNVNSISFGSSAFSDKIIFTVETL